MKNLEGVREGEEAVGIEKQPGTRGSGEGTEGEDRKRVEGR